MAIAENSAESSKGDDQLEHNDIQSSILEESTPMHRNISGDRLDDGSGATKQAPYRAYTRTSPQYISGHGVGKYKTALKNLIPIRKNARQKDMISVDRAGFLSFISFSWMSRYMYAAYKKGLTIEDIPQGSPLDSCDLNAQRLELLWQEEVRRNGPRRASFGAAVWRFIRTRVIMSSIVFSLSLAMGFISPTVFMRKLLQYAEDEEADTMTGVTWAVCLTLAEFLRTVFFAWNWALNYRTAVRLRSACLAMLYRKIIRLSNLGEKSIGELINLFANDGQRIFDMVLFGPMIIGGPVVTVCGVLYILWLLGSWAVLGMLVFLLFYPIQYGISRMMGYLRGKTVAVSDQRVCLMTEILTCIRFIKMYAWEKSFTNLLHKTRSKERNFLQKTAYCQSLSISMAPTIPVISAIVTFLAHISAGNNLTAAQAFSLICYLLQLPAICCLEYGSKIRKGCRALLRVQAFSVFTYLTKQARMALILIQESCVSLYEGLITVARFQAFSLIPFLGNQMKDVLSRIREGTRAVVEAIVAFSRFKSVLLLEDVSPYITRPIDKTRAVCISKGTFSWDAGALHASLSADQEKEKLNPYDGNENGRSGRSHILENINFQAPKGQLIGVCGPVGAGKTSLLLAALGQLHLVTGQVTRDGSCAYVSQEPWILNATLRENILFGESFDSKRYYEAVYCCALSQDIHLLPGGDQTEIGERGVNLSGGQKQRVALARALYANRDIYFLDDPLSAVDTHVGTHIFEKCIRQALQHKTVVLVTHQVQYLHQCDEVYLMKDGHIVEHGTHEDLMAKSKDYALMVQTRFAERGDQSEDTFQEVPLDIDAVESTIATSSNKRLSSTSQTSVEEIDKLDPTEGEQLTTAEAVQKGSIRLHTYQRYVSAAGGYCIALIVSLSFLLNVGSTAFSSWWLALWIKAGGGNTTLLVNNETVVSHNINDNPDFSMYQTVYAAMIAVILGTSFIRGVIFTKVTLRASTHLHNKLFRKMMRSPMLFFETTPVGRIQNLFSRDMDEVDTRLPITVESIMQNVWIVLFAVLFVCLVFPWFIIPLLILAVIYYIISKIFRVAVRDLKRLENMSRAPIFSWVGASVQGLCTIHAFGKESDFITRFTKMFDENTTCLYLCCIAMRWLAVRIDTLAVSTMCVTGFLVIILHGQVSPALAGLALAYAAHISGVFQYTIRLMSEAEVRFISVERINSYCESLQREGTVGANSKPPLEWPNKGSIKFQNVMLQYRKGLPAVLKDVSFTVQPGERLGIVGRTGSGKSSLITALFRLVELSSGKIRIDGLDIADVSLEQLRSRMSVIPQDPVLFDATIRWNLDPFEQHSDGAIWDVLEKTKLRDRVLSFTGQLQAHVGQGRDSLSVGERQLLCLARALLRNTKIVVLDEATASVDPETEAAVQSTIQEEFRECTILTVAHRLSTVTNCNRILVMDEGQVIELDTPANLMSDPNSVFSKLLSAVTGRS